MGRGEGEIDGARDVPAQSTEGKVLPFSARQGTQVSEGAPRRPHLSDPLGMSALVIELERSIAATAAAAVATSVATTAAAAAAKLAARPEARSEATAIPKPATPPPPRAEARPPSGQASVSNGASLPAVVNGHGGGGGATNGGGRGGG